MQQAHRRLARYEDIKEKKDGAEEGASDVVLSSNVDDAQPVRLPDMITTLPEMIAFEGKLEDNRYKAEMVICRQFPTAKTSMSWFASIFAQKSIRI